MRTLTNMEIPLTKTCRVCHKTKGLDCFYPHPTSRDGLLGKCAACATAYSKQRYMKDLEASRERSRQQYLKRKAARAAYYLATKELNAKKAAARLEVTKALYRGDLIRQPCEVCGNPKTDAHHPNYDEPLRVDWLCRLHHAARHVAAKLEAKEGGLRYGR